MSIAVQQQEPVAIPEVKATPTRRRGNGKTAREKLERMENQRKVRAAELEAQAQAARDRVAAEISFRREAQQNRIFEMYDAQEKARAPQFQIDQRGTLYVLGALAAVTFIATAILTADGTIGAAASARFAVPWFGYILFGAFEVAILAFMLMYYVLGSRVDHNGNRLKSTQWFVAMIVAAGLTVALSAYHVLDVYNWEWSNVDMWIGIGIRLSVALFFVAVSKGIATTIFARSVTL